MSTKRNRKRIALEIRILTPEECPDEDLRSFVRMVRQGGQVTSAGLEARIASAAWLGLARLGGKLAGVAALKVPRRAYHSKVFSAAQASEQAHRFPLEFGWAFVVPPFRGLGIAKALLGALLAKNVGGGTFATTRADNRFMERILRDAGFEILGQPFQSPRKETTNSLWVRPGLGI
jgi:GNAT superfamily N-acetyltransferase